jgi:hypothetical protein
MPAIANSAKQQNVQFYWHLGDFRLQSGMDQDYVDAYKRQNGRALNMDVYRDSVWDDFIAHQLDPFKRLGIPVYLSTGNHEFVFKTRADYDQKFAQWLTAPDIQKQREADGSAASNATSYYHWHHGPVDFITLDNGTPDEFDAAQMKWITAVLKRDEADRQVKTVVVGMHKALPDSIGCDHSMNDTPENQRSGREVYRELLDFHQRTKKPVYLLGSHSHFYMAGIFNDLPDNSRLPGWIVGTAGAERYPLPANTSGADDKNEWTYGYLLAAVNPDGTIKWDFKKVSPDDYASADKKMIESTYSGDARNFCWKDNRSKRERPTVACGVNKAE